MIAHEMVAPGIVQPQPHPCSFADPSGCLFVAGDRLFRGIAGPRVEFYRELFSRGIFQRLIERGLVVETEISEERLPGYGLVLEHRRIPFVSYPYEWSPRMYRDAALHLLDLALELHRDGLTLYDAHSFNTLFDFANPVYVDVGSIVAASPQPGWIPYDEFMRYFVYPLELMSKGFGEIARWTLLHKHHGGMMTSDYERIVPPRVPVRQRLAARSRGILRAAAEHLPPGLRRELRAARAASAAALRRASTGHHGPEAAVRQLRAVIESIDLPVRDSEWSHYEQPHDDPTGWNPKQRAVDAILSDLRPRTLIDIGCNRGWYAQLAAKRGANVVAVDPDEECVNGAYGSAKAMAARVLPLVMDIANPTPGIGLCNHQFEPAQERLRCEMAMALALVHHLVFKLYLRFEQIADALSAFCTRSLVVEFVPREDRYVREWWTPAYDWYTLEDFRSALSRHFDTIEIVPSAPAPRALLICSKTDTP